jgi:hypothetical protein
VVLVLPVRACWAAAMPAAWPVANAEAVVVIPELCHFLGHDCAPTSHADR